MKKFVTLLVSIVMVFGVFGVLTGCGNNAGKVKNIQNLSYNGEVITWSSVKNAKNYKIKIDNKSEFIVSQADTTVSYRYDAGGKDFDFSVEAIIKDGSDKNPKYSIHFENIGQVDGLKIENGFLKWNVKENADKYEIMYNGDILPNIIGETSYPMTEGEFSYKVRALKGVSENVDGNNPYYSVWSQSINGTVLPAPKNLTYNSEKFTWEKVDGATSYIIKLGNEEFTSTTNSYGYTAGTEDFKVSVIAVGDANKKIYNSKESEAKEYKYIAPIEGLNVVDGILKWTASENAIRYKIKIDGIVNNEELTANEYNELSSGKSYRIQILPIGESDFYFSRWSEEITINILRSPVVSFGDSVIKWNQVNGCEGYSIKITKDDKVIFTTTTGKDTFVYNYDFAEEGDYQVQVKATVLNNGGVYESKFSMPYNVKRLGTPSNNKITNRPLEKDQVAITFSPCVGASGYALLADDVEIATTKKETTFSVDLTKMVAKTQEAVVNFKIKALGSVTTDGAVLDSNKPLEFNVKRLATPQNVKISGDSISWDNVANTQKYVITIDGKRSEVTKTSHTLTDLAQGNHDIYIQAMGNGEEVITSGFSNVLSVKKLSKPTNLLIKNGLLTWGIIESATGYTVKLGTETFDTDTNSFDLLGYASNIAEGAGTQISVFANGNGSNIINSDVSDTKTISKYARPKEIKFSGDNLVWSPVSVDSINCNEYKLFINDGKDTKEVKVSGTSYPSSNFVAGEYTVEVVALGDNNITLDSPKSNAYTFTKLADITNFVGKDNSYTWDQVVGAVNYEIKLSKDSTWTTINTNSYTPKFEVEGETEISVKAVGNGKDIISSNVYSFTQRVERITQPVKQDEMTNKNAFKVEKVSNEIKVTMKKMAGATGYKLFISGIEKQASMSETETEVIFTYTMTGVGADYIVQVQYAGGVFANGKYMLDSNKSTEVKVTYNA